MKTEKRREKRLWSFHIRNKFTLVDFPVVLVLGTTYKSAEKRLREAFPSYLYDLVSMMQIANRDFMAICAVVSPDLRDYERV